MKILCLVSSFSGHLDFGGMGYVRLAQALSGRGHDLVWLAPPENCKTLSKEGFKVFQEPAIKSLVMSPFGSILDIKRYHEQYKERLNVLRSISASLARSKPDLILLDRILTFGAMIAEQLDIPYVPVGTPGGYWEIKQTDIHMSSKPIAALQEMGEQFRNDLGWDKGGLSSAWASSKNLNISFIGKGFYGEEKDNFPYASHVHHFDNNNKSSGECRIGVSFGSAGAVNRMNRVFECLRNSTTPQIPMDVFIGNRTDIPGTLTRTNVDAIRIHRWVDFSNYFPSLGCLAFFGGIGTLWSCLNYNVPILAVSGSIGDQNVNCANIARLGIGEYLDTRKLDCATVEDAVERLLNDRRYIERVREFKSIENYTDTMETAINKLEQL